MASFLRCRGRALMALRQVLPRAPLREIRPPFVASAAPDRRLTRLPTAAAPGPFGPNPATNLEAWLSLGRSKVATAALGGISFGRLARFSHIASGPHSSRHYRLLRLEAPSSSMARPRTFLPPAQALRSSSASATCRAALCRGLLQAAAGLGSALCLVSLRSNALALAADTHTDGALSTRTARTDESQHQQEAKYFSRALRWIRRFWLSIVLCSIVLSAAVEPLSAALGVSGLLWATRPPKESLDAWLEEEAARAAGESKGILHKLQAHVLGVAQVEYHDCYVFAVARVASITETRTVLGLLGEWWEIKKVQWSFVLLS